MSESGQSRPKPGFWLTRLLRAPKNSLAKTLLVPFVVGLSCAILVSAAAISLRPQYQLNQERNRQRNILAAADLLVPDQSVEELFRQIEPRAVDLSTGDYAAEIDPNSLLQAQASGETPAKVPIPSDLDIAVIKERSRYAVVYQVYDDDRLTMIILPVYGYGLWSTLYGYVALEADANTVVGLRFYQHGETPGLGGEIDNPRWLRLWPGKAIYGESDTPQIEVVKGATTASSDGEAAYQVDGISGATLTGRGVTNLLRYWFGEHGFGPFLRKLRENASEES